MLLPPDCLSCRLAARCSSNAFSWCTLLSLLCEWGYIPPFGTHLIFLPSVKSELWYLQFTESVSLNMWHSCFILWRSSVQIPARISDILIEISSYASSVLPGNGQESTSDEATASFLHRLSNKVFNKHSDFLFHLAGLTKTDEQWRGWSSGNTHRPVSDLTRVWSRESHAAAVLFWCIWTILSFYNPYWKFSRATVWPLIVSIMWAIYSVGKVKVMSPLCITN